MCVGSTTGYNANGPSSPDANGTWTPVERVTEEERQASYQTLLAENQATYAANGGTMAKDGQKRSGGTDNPFAANSAAMQQNALRTTMQNQQADRDARHLASMPRKTATQAQAPGKGGVSAAVGGGGPSTLLTGGTASDALVGKKSTVGKTSLLSG